MIPPNAIFLYAHDIESAAGGMTCGRIDGWKHSANRSRPAWQRLFHRWHLANTVNPWS